jgi:probable F420-dependent oxidoreductase
MAPFFSPPPGPQGAPRVLLAAVGEAMTRVAGEVADGLLTHAFTTERYLREVTAPTLDRGLTRAGRTREAFEISHQVLIATGQTEEAMASAVASTRNQIAFYGSTPAYRPVLDLHGWAGLGDELSALARSAREDRWTVMGSLIESDVLNAFAVVAEPDRIADVIQRRFGGVVDRISFYTTYDAGDVDWAPVVHQLHG